MINENLEKLVQHARDKKPTDFKTVLTDEIDSRINAKVTEIRDGLSKNMFKMHENCEGHPDGVEHTHEDGTVHTHPGGDKEHTHDDEESIHEAKISVATDASDWKPAKEAKKFNLKATVAKGKAKPSMPGGGDPDRLDLVGEEKDIVAFFKAHFGAEGNESLKDLQKEFGEEVEEGTLPPALQKAIDAKKKNNDKSDDKDKTPPKKDDDEDEDEDDSPVGKKDENIANFGNKKAKAFTDDDNPTDNKKKKDKKEETEIDEAGSRPITSSDLKAMAVETHTKSGFTAIASRNFPKPLPGIWLNDYVWEDKKIAVKAAQAWIDGFGDGDDYFKNAEQGTKALAKFAKSNKKSWHARVKGENLQQDTVDFLEKG